MDSSKWPSEQIYNLIHEHLSNGFITYDEVLSTMGDKKPIKIISRGDVLDMVENALKARGLNLNNLGYVTDKVIEDIEWNVGPDEISWDYLDITIEEVIQDLDIPFIPF